MKKFIPLAAVAVLALTFTSCKKDYSCTCTSTVGGSSASSTTSLGKQTKKDAKAACEALASSSTIGGTTYSVSCSLD